MATPNITIDKIVATADSVDTITIAGIPIGSSVVVKYMTAEETLYRTFNMTDNTIAITFAGVGDYKVEIIMDPYTDDDGTPVTTAIRTYMIKAVP